MKEALKGTDSEAIKAATEELSKKFYAVSEKLYQQAAPQGEPQQQAGSDGAQGADNVYDADYREVDNDDNK